MKSMSVKAMLLSKIREFREEVRSYLEALEESEKLIGVKDRLSNVLISTYACSTTNRVLKEMTTLFFQDPSILTLVPTEELREIVKELLEIAIEIIKYDAQHTGEYRDYLSALIDAGAMPRVFADIQRKRREERERLQYTL